MADPVGVTGCAFWVDASDVSTIHHTTNLLDTWDDKSGAGRNLTSATTERPTVNSRTQNDLSVVDFDGTDDSMITSSFTAGQPFTLFVVAQNDDGANSTQQPLFDHRTGSLVRVFKGSANDWNIHAGAQLSGGTADTVASYFSVLFNTTASKLWRDGVQQGSTGTAGTNTIVNGICIGRDGGSSVFWDGWIGEILLYDGALSDGDRGTVEAYLNNKWFVAAVTYIRPTIIVGASQAAQRSSRW